jgi:hypothetical protein
MRAALMAALLVVAGPAWADAASDAKLPCRVNFGGIYSFPHSGVKPGGIAYGGLAYFDFYDDHTFGVWAYLNTTKGFEFFSNQPTATPDQQMVPTKQRSWLENCLLAIGPPDEMEGYVSDDGQTIGIMSFTEIVAGTATRNTNGKP